VATAIGPFLGGWLVQAVSWRLIFVINLPVAGMIVAVSVRHLPESRDREMTGRVDITGRDPAMPGWPGRSCHPPVSRPRSALMSLRPRSGRSRRYSHGIGVAPDLAGDPASNDSVAVIWSGPPVDCPTIRLSGRSTGNRPG
jgi:MFS family permease